MKKDLITEIQSRGYWRINFQPLVVAEKLKSLGECKDLIEKNYVMLRGWNFPHFPSLHDETSGLETCSGYYLGWTNWRSKKEFWHMYQSGQFLEYLALAEDWFAEDGWFTASTREIKPGTKLNIIGSVLYQVTEFYEFLSRLTSAGIYDEGVRVSITLSNTKERELWIADSNRSPFNREYRTGAEKIEFIKEYSKSEVATSSKDLAFALILHIFDHFGWHNPPIPSLKQDQENFLLGKTWS